MTAADGATDGATRVRTAPGAEGFRRGSRRGSRARAVGVHGDWAGFRIDKLVLSSVVREGPIGRRKRAQGFTNGGSWTPREPLVNPSNTPGEPLKPLKEKKDPFMRPPVCARRHNPLLRSEGFTGFTADVLAVLTGVAIVALAWWWTTTAAEYGAANATVRLTVATMCMAVVALARREIADWERSRSSRGRSRGRSRQRRNPSARWSRPRAENRALDPLAERAALDSETSTIGSRYDRL